jgi:hypothetical protein
MKSTIDEPLTGKLAQTSPFSGRANILKFSIVFTTFFGKS